MGEGWMGGFFWRMRPERDVICEGGLEYLGFEEEHTRPPGSDGSIYSRSRRPGVYKQRSDMQRFPNTTTGGLKDVRNAKGNAERCI